VLLALSLWLEQTAWSLHAGQLRTRLLRALLLRVRLLRARLLVPVPRR
jgi:hypothetical protein